MFKEVLAACLLAQLANASPQWTFLHQPMVYHTSPVVYQQPTTLYTYQNFKSALTGHAGTQKVTTYNKVVPYAMDFQDPRFFLEFCEGRHRFYGLGFYLMDANNDGKISFPEVSVFTQDQDKFKAWMYDVETTLQDQIQTASGDEDLMFSKVAYLAAQEFNTYDTNNDNVLNMREFYDYMELIHDGVAFYFRSLKNMNGNNELIEQDEWDCSHEQIADGDCNPDSYDQTLITGMIGNNGDEVLTIWEYRKVMQFYKQVAIQFEKFELFCQNDQVDNLS
jgi:hypothetical protein